MKIVTIVIASGLMLSVRLATAAGATSPNPAAWDREARRGYFPPRILTCMSEAGGMGNGVCWFRCNSQAIANNVTVQGQPCELIKGEDCATPYAGAIQSATFRPPFNYLVVIGNGPDLLCK